MCLYQRQHLKFVIADLPDAFRIPKMNQTTIIITHNCAMHCKFQYPDTGLTFNHMIQDLIVWKKLIVKTENYLLELFSSSTRFSQSHFYMQWKKARQNYSTLALNFEILGEQSLTLTVCWSLSYNTNLISRRLVFGFPLLKSTTAPNIVLATTSLGKDKFPVPIAGKATEVYLFSEASLRESWIILDKI